MTDDTIEVPRDALVQRTIDIALEVGQYDDFRVPDDCDDWSLKDMDVDYVTTDGSTVIVEGLVEGSVTTKVASARYNPPGKAHPAEYERHDVPIDISIRWDLEKFAKVGEIKLYAQARKDPSEPPAPDI
jgi:hypothetical protein